MQKLQTFHGSSFHLLKYFLLFHSIIKIFKILLRFGFWLDKTSTSRGGCMPLRTSQVAIYILTFVPDEMRYSVDENRMCMRPQ